MQHGEPRGWNSGALVWLIPLAMLATLAWFLFASLNGAAPLPADSVNGAAGSKGFPRTLRFADGRQIVIPARPQRVVPANAGAADILAELLDAGRMAGVPAQVDFAACDMKYWQAHKSLPRFEHYQAEPILALKPDLVISSMFQDANTTRELERVKIPLLSLHAFETFAGIRDAMRFIGQAVGEDEKARALVAKFDDRLTRVEQRLVGTRPVRVLGYSNFGSGYAVGAGGSQDEILRWAGATNAAEELKMEGPTAITFEQIIKIDPDVIMVCGDKELESPQAQVVLNEPALRGLRAVRERRIAAVPSRYFDALSQYVADAVEILARQLHPESVPPGNVPPGGAP